MPNILLPLFQSAVKAWWDDDALRLGASLAYYTLFAIAPILLVATAIAGMVFGAEAVRGEIVGQLDHLIGREGARAVQSLPRVQRAGSPAPCYLCARDSFDTGQTAKCATASSTMRCVHQAAYQEASFAISQPPRVPCGSS